jgi:tight adherence protein B
MLMEALLANPMLPIALGGLGLVLIVVFVVVIITSRGSEPKEVGERLTTFAGRDESGQDDAGSRQAMERIDAVVSKSKQGNNIARDLARADLKLTVTEFIGTKLLSALVGAGVGAVIGRANPAAIFLAALVGAVIFSFVPNIYVSQRASRRIKMFNDQLGDTISMMANALRGGFSFLQTLDMVSKEAPQPVAGEFRRIVQEVGLGRSTEEALQSLVRRMPSEDLELLITAVNIQMEVGGNLAQILDTIGHTIRERVRIKGEIKTLTAQGQISAYVITGLPIVLAIMISLINPEYMAPIFEFGLPPDAWCCLPVASLVMIAVGYFAIMKIIDIEI